jgi:TP901 family phage tail tape measure protein
MANSFDLTAKLTLTGPFNLKPVIDKLRTQIGGVKIPLNVTLPKNVTAFTTQLNTAFTTLNATLVTHAQTMQSVVTSLNAAAAAASKASKSVNQNTQAAKKHTSTLKKTSTQVKETTDAVEEFGRVSGLAFRRYAGFTIATTLTFGFLRATKQAISEAIDFERQLIKVSQVTHTSAEGLRGLRAEMDRLSTGLGTPIDQLNSVALTLGQAGLSSDETKAALEALARTTLTATFTDINEAAQGAVAVMNQFDISAHRLMEVMGSMNAIAAQFPVEADDLIGAVRRVGGVFKAAAGQAADGMQTFQELLALFTSIRATTRESAESIATGLRTIITRIQRPSTIGFLQTLEGVNLQDAQGEFIGTYRAVEQLNRVLLDLSTNSEKFAQIAEQLGGFRQIGKTIPLLTRFSLAQEALKAAQEGQTSLYKDTEKALDGMGRQIERVHENFRELIRNIVVDQGFKSFITAVTDIAHAFIELSEAVKPILPVLLTFSTIKISKDLYKFAGGFKRGLIQSGKVLDDLASGDGSATAQKQTRQTQAKMGDLVVTLKALDKRIASNNNVLTRLHGAQSRLVNVDNKLITAITNLTRAVDVTSTRLAALSAAGFGGRGRRQRPTSGGSIKRFATGGYFDSTGQDHRKLTIQKHPSQPMVGQELFKFGGQKQYEDARTITTPGEGIVLPERVQKIGLRTLNAMNQVHKDKLPDNTYVPRSDIHEVPGVGNTDRVKGSTPVGSFVIQKPAMKVLKKQKIIRAQKGGMIGHAGFSEGGMVKTRQRFQAGGEVGAINPPGLESDLISPILVPALAAFAFSLKGAIAPITLFTRSVIQSVKTNRQYGTWLDKYVRKPLEKTRNNIAKLGLGKEFAKIKGFAGFAAIIAGADFAERARTAETEGGRRGFGAASGAALYGGGAALFGAGLPVIGGAAAVGGFLEANRAVREGIIGDAQKKLNIASADLTKTFEKLKDVDPAKITKEQFEKFNQVLGEYTQKLFDIRTEGIEATRYTTLGFLQGTIGQFEDWFGEGPGSVLGQFVTGVAGQIIGQRPQTERGRALDRRTAREMGGTLPFLFHALLSDTFGRQRSTDLIQSEQRQAVGKDLENVLAGLRSQSAQVESVFRQDLMRNLDMVDVDLEKVFTILASGTEGLLATLTDLELDEAIGGQFTTDELLKSLTIPIGAVKGVDTLRGTIIEKVINDSAKRLNLLVYALEKVQSSAELAARAGDIYSSSIERTVTSLTGLPSDVGTVDTISPIFENLQGATEKQLEQAVAETRPFVGGALPEAEKALRLFKAVEENFGKIIQEASEYSVTELEKAAGFTGEETEQEQRLVYALERFIQTRLGEGETLGPSGNLVVDQVRRYFLKRQNAGGIQTTETAALDLGIAELTRDQFQKIGNLFSTFARQRQEAEKQYIDVINQSAKFSLEAANNFNESAKLGARTNLIIAKARGRDSSLGQLTTPFRLDIQQNLQRAGIQAPGFNPQVVQQRVVELQSNIDDLARQRQGTSGDVFKTFTDQMMNLRIQLAHANQALEKFAKSNEFATAAQRKLSDIENRRRFGQGFLEEFIGGGQAGRRNMMQELAEGANVLQGGSFSPFGLIGQAQIRGLKRLEDFFKALGDESGVQRVRTQRNRAANELFGDTRLAALFDTQTEEDQIISELAKHTQIQQDTLNILGEIRKDAALSLRDDASTRFDVVSSELAKTAERFNTYIGSIITGEDTRQEVIRQHLDKYADGIDTLIKAMERSGNTFNQSVQSLERIATLLRDTSSINEEFIRKLEQTIRSQTSLIDVRSAQQPELDILPPGQSAGGFPPKNKSKRLQSLVPPGEDQVVGVRKNEFILREEAVQGLAKEGVDLEKSNKLGRLVVKGYRDGGPISRKYQPPDPDELGHSFVTQFETIKKYAPQAAYVREKYLDGEPITVDNVQRLDRHLNHSFSSRNDKNLYATIRRFAQAKEGVQDNVSADLASADLENIGRKKASHLELLDKYFNVKVEPRKKGERGTSAQEARLRRIGAGIIEDNTYGPNFRNAFRARIDELGFDGEQALDNFNISLSEIAKHSLSSSDLVSQQYDAFDQLAAEYADSLKEHGFDEQFRNFVSKAYARQVFRDTRGQLTKQEKEYRASRGRLSGAVTDTGQLLFDHILPVAFSLPKIGYGALERRLESLAGSAGNIGTATVAQGLLGGLKGLGVVGRYGERRLGQGVKAAKGLAFGGANLNFALQAKIAETYARLLGQGDSGFAQVAKGVSERTGRLGLAGLQDVGTGIGSVFTDLPSFVGVPEGVTEKMDKDYVREQFKGLTDTFSEGFTREQLELSRVGISGVEFLAPVLGTKPVGATVGKVKGVPGKVKVPKFDFKRPRPELPPRTSKATITEPTIQELQRVVQEKQTHYNRIINDKEVNRYQKRKATKELETAQNDLALREESYRADLEQQGILELERRAPLLETRTPTQNRRFNRIIDKELRSSTPAPIEAELVPGRTVATVGPETVTRAVTATKVVDESGRVDVTQATRQARARAAQRKQETQRLLDRQRDLEIENTIEPSEVTTTEISRVGQRLEEIQREAVLDQSTGVSQAPKLVDSTRPLNRRGATIPEEAVTEPIIVDAGTRTRLRAADRRSPSDDLLLPRRQEVPVTIDEIVTANTADLAGDVYTQAATNVRPSTRTGVTVEPPVRTPRVTTEELIARQSRGVDDAYQGMKAADEQHRTSLREYEQLKAENAPESQLIDQLVKVNERRTGLAEARRHYVAESSRTKQITEGRPARSPSRQGKEVKREFDYTTEEAFTGSRRRIEGTTQDTLSGRKFAIPKDKTQWPALAETFTKLLNETAESLGLPTLERTGTKVEIVPGSYMSKRSFLAQAETTPASKIPIREVPIVRAGKRAPPERPLQFEEVLDNQISLGKETLAATREKLLSRQQALKEVEVKPDATPDMIEPRRKAVKEAQKQVRDTQKELKVLEKKRKDYDVESVPLDPSSIPPFREGKIAVSSDFPSISYDTLVHELKHIYDAFFGEAVYKQQRLQSLRKQIRYLEDNVPKSKTAKAEHFENINALKRAEEGLTSGRINVNDDFYRISEQSRGPLRDFFDETIPEVKTQHTVRGTETKKIDNYYATPIEVLAEYLPLNELADLVHRVFQGNFKGNQYNYPDMGLRALTPSRQLRTSYGKDATFHIQTGGEAIRNALEPGKVGRVKSLPRNLDDYIPGYKDMPDWIRQERLYAEKKVLEAGPNKAARRTYLDQPFHQRDFKNIRAFGEGRKWHKDIRYEMEQQGATIADYLNYLEDVADAYKELQVELTVAHPGLAVDTIPLQPARLGRPSKKYVDPTEAMPTPFEPNISSKAAGEYAQKLQQTSTERAVAVGEWVKARQDFRAGTYHPEQTSPQYLKTSKNRYEKAATRRQKAIAAHEKLKKEGLRVRREAFKEEQLPVPEPPKPPIGPKPPEPKPPIGPKPPEPPTGPIEYTGPKPPVRIRLAEVVKQKQQGLGKKTRIGLKAGAVAAFGLYNYPLFSSIGRLIFGNKEEEEDKEQKLPIKLPMAEIWHEIQDVRDEEGIQAAIDKSNQLLPNLSREDAAKIRGLMEREDIVPSAAMTTVDEAAEVGPAVPSISPARPQPSVRPQPSIRPRPSAQPKVRPQPSRRPTTRPRLQQPGVQPDRTPVRREPSVVPGPIVSTEAEAIEELRAQQVEIPRSVTSLNRDTPPREAIETLESVSQTPHTRALKRAYSRQQNMGSFARTDREKIEVARATRNLGLRPLVDTKVDDDDLADAGVIKDRVEAKQRYPKTARNRLAIAYARRKFAKPNVRDPDGKTLADVVTNLTPDTPPLQALASLERVPSTPDIRAVRRAWSRKKNAGTFARTEVEKAEVVAAIDRLGFLPLFEKPDANAQQPIEPDIELRTEDRLAQLHTQAVSGRREQLVRLQERLGLQGVEPLSPFFALQEITLPGTGPGGFEEFQQMQQIALPTDIQSLLDERHPGARTVARSTRPSGRRLARLQTNVLTSGLEQQKDELRSAIDELNVPYNDLVVLFQRMNQPPEKFPEFIKFLLDKAKQRRQDFDPTRIAGGPRFGTGGYVSSKKGIAEDYAKDQPRISDDIFSMADSQVQSSDVRLPKKKGLKRFAKGGKIPAMVQSGETIFDEELTKKNINVLTQLNRGGITAVPGSGTTDDTFAMLPADGFVLNKKGTKKLKKMARGGPIIPDEQGFINLEEFAYLLGGQPETGKIITEKEADIAAGKTPKKPDDKSPRFPINIHERYFSISEDDKGPDLTKIPQGFTLGDRGVVRRVEEKRQTSPRFTILREGVKRVQREAQAIKDKYSTTTEGRPFDVTLLREDLTQAEGPVRIEDLPSVDPQVITQAITSPIVEPEVRELPVPDVKYKPGQGFEERAAAFNRAAQQARRDRAPVTTEEDIDDFIDRISKEVTTVKRIGSQLIVTKKELKQELEIKTFNRRLEQEHNRLKQRLDQTRITSGTDSDEFKSIKENLDIVGRAKARLLEKTPFDMFMEEEAKQMAAGKTEQEKPFQDTLETKPVTAPKPVPPAIPTPTPITTTDDVIDTTEAPALPDSFLLNPDIIARAILARQETGRPLSEDQRRFADAFPDKIKEAQERAVGYEARRQQGRRVSPTHIAQTILAKQDKNEALSPEQQKFTKLYPELLEEAKKLPKGRDKNLDPLTTSHDIIARSIQAKQELGRALTPEQKQFVRDYPEKIKQAEDRALGYDKRRRDYQRISPIHIAQIILDAQTAGEELTDEQKKFAEKYPDVLKKAKDLPRGRTKNLEALPLEHDKLARAILTRQELGRTLTREQEKFAEQYPAIIAESKTRLEGIDAIFKKPIDRITGRSASRQIVSRLAGGDDLSENDLETLRKQWTLESEKKNKPGKLFKDLVVQYNRLTGQTISVLDFNKFLFNDLPLPDKHTSPNDILFQAAGLNKGGKVPAMLTPGEIIVPPEVTKRNLPFLQNVNSGKFTGFGSGGVVPGTGNRDSVFSMLQEGSFVINKRSSEFLRNVQQFENGGRVSGTGFQTTDQAPVQKAFSIDISSKSLGSLTTFNESFAGHINTLITGLNGFSSALNESARKLSEYTAKLAELKLPEEIIFKGMINEGQPITVTLNGQDALTQKITEEVAQKVEDMILAQFNANTIEGSFA